MYYRDAPVVRSIATFDWYRTYRLFPVLKCTVPLVPLSLPDIHDLWYCSGVLLAIGHIYFVCSGHSGVVELVPLIFWCIFPLLPLTVKLHGLHWEVSDLCTYIPYLNQTLDVGLSDLSPL